MTQQRGFGVVAAIVILVILAVLASAIVSFGSAQQIASAQDVMSAKAWQAARAGNEWGLHKALHGTAWSAAAGDTCDNGSVTATLDLSADTGFHITVSCNRFTYNEGESTPGTAKSVTVYRITAVACTAAVCPSPSAAIQAGAAYVERTRVVLATN